MVRKYRSLIALAAAVLIGTSLGYYFLSKSSNGSQLLLAKAARREIRVVVSTNGIIEPLDRTQIYSPLDAFVKNIQIQEGSEITRGQSLMHLQAEPIRTALAEARAALLEAKRQAHIIVAGPPKEELSTLDASIAESVMQLNQLAKDMLVEESLYAKGATSREAVENLLKQRDLLQLRVDAFKQRRQDLFTRYSAQEKEWEQGKVNELNKQVELLEQQVRMESIIAPKSGLLYSLSIKPGSYVGKGQLLAQIYTPGKVMLRAYVDEPDLGRIEKGQPTRIEWNGMPNRHWTGVVDKLADQVIALDDRSIGYVLSTIDSGPKGLIPNLNVKVEITTAIKADALVVPRSAVFNHNGTPAVLLLEGNRTITKPVDLGLVTPEEIEIIHGIDAGSSIVLNHAEVGAYSSP